MREILSQLNSAFDHRNRLGIMVILIANEWVEYNTMKDLLSLTDGNLASHLRLLEQADYILVRKEFVGRKTRTTYTTTDAGKHAFQQHLTALENVILLGKEE